MCKGPVQATSKISTQSTQLNTEIPILQGLLVYEYKKRKHNIEVGIMSYAWIARFFVQNVEVCRHIFLVRLTMDWYVCPCPYVCECSPTYITDKLYLSTINFSTSLYLVANHLKVTCKTSTVMIDVLTQQRSRINDSSQLIVFRNTAKKWVNLYFNWQPWTTKGDLFKTQSTVSNLFISSRWVLLH